MDDPVHQDHSGDARGVKRLAARFVARGRYPFGGEDIDAAGLDDGAVARLERSGWVVREGGGQWRFGHDRLLNWAVAEALVARWAADETAAADLASTIDCLGEGRTPAGETRPPRLGFLLMDVVWLAANNREIGAARLASLLRELEARIGHGYPEELYKRLLPTAGPTVLPALETRIGEEPDEGSPIMTRLFAGALLKIAQLDGSRVAEAAARLWRSPGRAARATAMRWPRECRSRSYERTCGGNSPFGQRHSTIPSGAITSPTSRHSTQSTSLPRPTVTGSRRRSARRRARAPWPNVRG